MHCLKSFCSTQSIKAVDHNDLFFASETKERALVSGKMIYLIQWYPNARYRVSTQWYNILISPRNSTDSNVRYRASAHRVLHLFLFGTAVRAVTYVTVTQHIDSPEFSEINLCKGTCMVTQCVWLAIHAAREQHETKKLDQLVTEQRGQKENTTNGQ